MFGLLFGKLYTIFPIKLVFLTVIVIFEAGSAICGAAPTSAIFIGGRAVAGLGAAGIFQGALVTVAYTVPVKSRPLCGPFLFPAILTAT
jgi:MFS family permease